MSSLFALIWSTVPATVVGIVWGILADEAIGIMGGITVGAILSLIWSWNSAGGLISEVSVIVGIVLSRVQGFMGHILRHVLGGIIASLIYYFFFLAGFLAFFLLMLLATSNLAILSWMILSWNGNAIIVGALIGIVDGLGIVDLNKRGHWIHKLGTVALWGLLGIVLGAIIKEVLGSVGATFVATLAATMDIPERFALPATVYMLISLALVVPCGLVGGLFKRGIRKGIEEGTLWGVVWSILLGWFGWNIGHTIDIANGFAVFGAIMYAMGYILDASRLPLYPVDSFSVLMMYKASKKNPSQVFSYIHNSSLYWDRLVILPLPLLRGILEITLNQDIEQALEEVIFIVTRHPSQKKRLQRWLLRIILQELEHQETLGGIAGLSLYLAKFLPLTPKLLTDKWVARLTRINDAIQDTVNYRNANSWLPQRDSLKNLIKNLNEIEITDLSKKSPRPKKNSRPTREEELDQRLDSIVKRWLSIAHQELKILEQEFGEIGQIHNPYVPGPVLELGNSLFVGRHKLVLQLQRALDRGRHHPTFSLNGERRMGKSSTLQQLPKLLSNRYIPVYYDLQNRGMSSSTVTFLSVIAEEIYNIISAKAIEIEKMKEESLQDARRQNEAAIYFAFNEWLKDIERVLEQKDKMLLLTLDEFEKLEEAGIAQYLDLNLLLDWFRNMIQTHHRVALLFSGVKSVVEMGPNWAGYFVNVQTLPVSFLEPEEAYQLITRPIRHFPSEQVFGEGVVKQIMHVTGCHPFLIQAVCSELIDELNIHGRQRAEIQDVTVAVEQVLESWWDTYFRDLWERTDQDQRLCLIILNKLNEGTVQQIAQQSNLSESAILNTLQTLRKRDLVVIENNSYRIAAPIFSEQVKRSS